MDRAQPTNPRPDDPACNQVTTPSDRSNPGAELGLRHVCPNCQDTEMDPRVAREQCRRCDPDGVNSRAEFAPQAEPYTRPCLTVAGAQFYAYLDQRGCYKLSVHLDTAEVHYGPQHPATATAQAPFDHTAEFLVPIRIVGDDGTEVADQQYPRRGCRCVYRTHARPMTDGEGDGEGGGCSTGPVSVEVTTLIWRDPQCPHPRTGTTEEPNP